MQSGLRRRRAWNRWRKRALRRADGEYRWFLFRASSLKDELGSTVKWYGVSTDIEDLKRAEAELRRSKTLLVAGQELSLTGSFSWRLDTDDLIFSEELYRIFEFEAGEPVTHVRIAERVHPDDHGDAGQEHTRHSRR